MNVSVKNTNKGHGWRRWSQHNFWNYMNGNKDMQDVRWAFELGMGI